MSGFDSPPPEREQMQWLMARVDTLTRAVEEVTREKAAEGLRVHEEIIKREVAEAALAAAQDERLSLQSRLEDCK